ncbi:hypothetical protein ACFFRR_009515 [Megaselia abdita]
MITSTFHKMCECVCECQNDQVRKLVEISRLKMCASKKVFIIALIVLIGALVCSQANPMEENDSSKFLSRSKRDVWGSMERGWCNFKVEVSYMWDKFKSWFTDDAVIDTRSMKSMLCDTKSALGNMGINV